MAKKKTATAKSGSSLPATQNEREDLYLAKTAGQDVAIPATENTRLERYLKAIVSRISSIISLPAVTEADNGRTLQVLNGEWSISDVFGFKYFNTAAENPAWHAAFLILFSNVFTAALMNAGTKAASAFGGDDNAALVSSMSDMIGDYSALPYLRITNTGTSDMYLSLISATSSQEFAFKAAFPYSIGNNPFAVDGFLLITSTYTYLELTANAVNIS